jgi:hypothetical protein
LRRRSAASRISSTANDREQRPRAIRNHHGQRERHQHIKAIGLAREPDQRQISKQAIGQRHTCEAAIHAQRRAEREQPGRQRQHAPASRGATPHSPKQRQRQRHDAEVETPIHTDRRAPIPRRGAPPWMQARREYIRQQVYHQPLGVVGRVDIHIRGARSLDQHGYEQGRGAQPEQPANSSQAYK